MNNYRSESLKNLIPALIKAQIQMDPAIKRTKNPHFKSLYAKMESLMEIVQPALAANNLVITQLMAYEDGNRFLKTILLHNSDEWIMSYEIIKPRSDSMADFGAYVSYLRRYQYFCITGIIIEDEHDDDGARDAKENDHKKETAKPQEEYITPEQLRVLQNAIGNNEDIYKELLSKLKIGNLKYMWKKVFEHALDFVNQTKREMESSRP